jgi:tetratricopeptide (TPR) repeat protein
MVVAGALLVIGTGTAFGQVGRIEGDVKKAGTGEPIIGAQVEIVRTDIRGSYPVKTDKKGHFLHAGVPYVGTYTLLVSAEGYAPTFLAGIRPTGEPLVFELSPGDGRRLTMDEVRKSQAATPTTAGKPPSAEEVKKQQEAMAKAQAENEKAKADFENMKKSFEEGRALASNKDYAGAITKFKEAVTFDPDQHVIHANLALALYNRGATQLNAGQRDAAKQDFVDSAASMGKGLTIVEPLLADPAKGAEAKKNKASYLKIRADANSVLGKRFNDQAAAEAAVADYNLAATLTDLPEEKKSFALKGASTLFESNLPEKAVAAYQEILKSDADNTEALYNMGLAYASLGKFQEAANTLQLFVDKAPDTDQRKAEAKAVIKDLIVGNNLEPPKSDGGRGRTRKKP